MFKQEIPRLGLSIQKGTDSVPRDEKFHVVLEGRIIYSSASEKDALAFYRGQRDELLAQAGSIADARPDRDELLRRIRTESDVYAVRADSFRRREALANRRGGKGGRGGV